MYMLMLCYPLEGAEECSPLGLVKTDVSEERAIFIFRVEEVTRATKGVG
jgi:hypothetical protein